jgi:hypothetical protein
MTQGDDSVVYDQVQTREPDPSVPQVNASHPPPWRGRVQQGWSLIARVQLPKKTLTPLRKIFCKCCLRPLMSPPIQATAGKRKKSQPF